MEHRRLYPIQRHLCSERKQHIVTGEAVVVQDFTKFSLLDTDMQYMIDLVVVIYSVDEHGEAVHSYVDVLCSSSKASSDCAFVVAAFMMYGPVKKLSRVNTNLQQAIAASERIFEILDVHTEVLERPGAVPLPPFEREIEFTDVTFAYEDGHGRSTLRGVSLSVRAGQMVAIVGRSGAGKTTLVNLLLRFYDVNAGSIRVDGIDIRERPRGELRRMFGMVLQDTWLFSGSIRDNIGYGRDGASDDEIFDFIDNELGTA